MQICAHSNSPASAFAPPPARNCARLALALAAIIVTSSAFLMSRVDRVEDRLSRLESNVNDLPGKLTSSLNQINQTLFQAIAATKQTPPQIILLPAPDSPTPPKSDQKPN
jgi:hypothetical protein